MRRFLVRAGLVAATLGLTLALLETGAYVVLRLTPESNESFRDLIWMRKAFHPLFRARSPETYGFWPYTGYFFNPTWKTAPADLPRPYPEAYVYQDLWGRRTPLTKPAGELRVFVLGGSTIMGQGSSSADWTVPGRLEHWLRSLQPPGSPWSIRVVNAGVGGYASTQEQVHIATRLLAYSPDAFVVVDGYNDFLELWSAPQLPVFWNDYSKHLYEGFHRMQSPPGLLGQLGFLMSKRLYCLSLPRAWLRYRRMRRETGVGGPVASVRDIVRARADRAVWMYAANMRTMLGAAAAHRIPLLMALQPTLAYGKTRLSAEEQGLLDAQEREGNTGWRQAITSFYPRLRAVYREAAREYPAGVVDRSEVFRGEPGTLYGDHCHYNDAGADILARSLAPSVYAALRRRAGRGL
ncbi:MAG: SGNH/GDSL hydrolase family protein [Elusimicrobia bacterium]|nr:SGNH/GDSL hydrolase family protein [Elusimicrobiota bacterium]